MSLNVKVIAYAFVTLCVAALPSVLFTAGTYWLSDAFEFGLWFVLSYMFIAMGGTFVSHGFRKDWSHSPVSAVSVWFVAFSVAATVSAIFTEYGSFSGETLLSTSGILRIVGVSIILGGFFGYFTLKNSEKTAPKKSESSFEFEEFDETKN